MPPRYNKPGVYKQMEFQINASNPRFVADQAANKWLDDWLDKMENGELLNNCLAIQDDSYLYDWSGIDHFDYLAAYIIMC